MLSTAAQGTGKPPPLPPPYTSGPISSSASFSSSSSTSSARSPQAATVVTTPAPRPSFITRKTSIAALLSSFPLPSPAPVPPGPPASPSLPPPPTVRHWVQATVTHITADALRVSDGTAALSIATARCRRWELEPIYQGSLVMAVGLVRESEAEGGWALHPHTLKDVSGERSVRERMWKVELDLVADAERRRQHAERTRSTGKGGGGEEIYV